MTCSQLVYCSRTPALRRRRACARRARHSGLCRALTRTCPGPGPCHRLVIVEGAPSSSMSSWPCSSLVEHDSAANIGTIPVVAIVSIFDHSLGVDRRPVAFVGAVFIQSSDTNGHRSLLGSALVIALGRTVLIPCFSCSIGALPCRVRLRGPAYRRRRGRARPSMSPCE